MPSPFPGMNPYMEQPAAWAGVHLHLLANFGQQLAPQVRPRYRVHTERYLAVGGEPRKFRPDLRLEHTPSHASTGVHPAGIAVTEALLVVEDQPFTDEDIPPHLEIIAEDGEVVTVIEVLSPINKQGEYKSYLHKRYQLLKAGINLIEIDLLREGQRVPPAAEIETPYVCLVTRASEWPKTHLWGVSWAQPCPVLPIPLRAGEPDVRLQLQPAVEQAYSVEFEGFVDYNTEPFGTLTEVWRAEIKTILKPSRPPNTNA